MNKGDKNTEQKTKDEEIVPTRPLKLQLKLLDKTSHGGTDIYLLNLLEVMPV
jgi:hypothetical protein